MSTKKTKAAAPAAEATPVIVAYKGFDAKLQCRGMQYAIGQTVVHDGAVKACSTGLHSCENPLDVFGYYEPGTSRFALVEASGEISREAGGDSKIASAKLHIKAELMIPEFIQTAIAWVTSHCVPADAHHATGDRSASSATGYSSASSATGDSSASSATGDRSASSATGIAAVAMNIGRFGKSKAGEGGAIVLCYHNDDLSLRHIFSSKVGDNGIKPDVFYTLDENGKPQEVSA